MKVAGRKEDNIYEQTEHTFGQYRASSIELFRIITMLCIVAHHYVVNSGIMDEISQTNVMEPNSLFCLLFGWGGKTGVNCFILITGYFMCQSNINLKKFLKLLLEIELYKIVFYLIFLFTGYESFSLKALIKVLLPIYGIGTGFSNSYLVFFLFIPYLNLLIKAMNEKQHLILGTLCLVVGTILPTFLKTPTAFTYVGWFMVLYFFAAYIRLYPKTILEKTKVLGWATVVSLILSWCSVIAGSWLYEKTGKAIYYYFVSDSNKFLAVLTSVCAFLFFKNLNMKYYPIINKIAASTFGVLMIHANSDTMRQWLWKDACQNVKAFHSDYLIAHAVISVLAIYGICTLIDMARIRFLERPFFQWYSKTFNGQNEQ